MHGNFDHLTLNDYLLITTFSNNHISVIIICVKCLKLKEKSNLYMELQNLRPEIPRCCPSALSNVMKRCWDANPDKRPEMDEVVAMLEAVDTTKGGGMLPHDHPQGCLCFRRYRGP